MVGYVAFSALFWLFIFSIMLYKLSRQQEAEYEKYRELVIPFLFIAWASTVGTLIYDYLKAWFF